MLLWFAEFRTADAGYSNIGDAACIAIVHGLRGRTLLLATGSKVHRRHYRIA
jgi:hypothetical protein